MSRKPQRRSSATGGYYVYPLPPSEWTPGRIDQGVDYVNKSASSRILAIGNAKVLATGATGWPGEGGVLYQLLDGPKKGSVVYVYENVKPTVKAGQTVRAGQVIATMKGTGYPWLEMGWANSAGVPLSHGEYTEGKETVAGKDFKRFLAPLPKMGPNGGFPFHFKNKAEEERIKKIAGEENLGESVLPSPGDVASEVANGLGSLLSGHAEALMLNIGLVGGGAFLVYYGAALMLGVKQPAKPFVDAAKVAAAPK